MLLYGMFPDLCLVLNAPKNLDGISYGCDVINYHLPLSVLLPEVATAHVALYVVQDLAKGLALVECGARIAHELHLHSSLSEYELLAAQVFSQTP